MAQFSQYSEQYKEREGTGSKAEESKRERDGGFMGTVPGFEYYGRHDNHAPAPPTGSVRSSSSSTCQTKLMGTRIGSDPGAVNPQTGWSLLMQPENGDSDDNNSDSYDTLRVNNVPGR